MLLSVNTTKAVTAVPRITAGCFPRTALPARPIYPSVSYTPFPSRPSVRQVSFVCSAEALSAESSSASGSIVDYALGQGNYQLFAAFTLVLNVAVLVAAPKVMETVFGVTPMPVANLMYRAGISLLLVGTSIAYCMQSAVAANRLDSPTYKRLAFALALSTLGIMVFKFFYMSFHGFAPPTVGTWFSSIIQVMPTIAFLKLYGTSTLSDIVPGVLSGIRSVFQPDNLNAVFYSLFTVVTMIIAVGAWITPSTMASALLAPGADNFSYFVIQCAACMMFMTSITCFTLKDAADRGRLGFSTFKTLNIGLCAAGIARIVNALYLAGVTAAAAPAPAVTTAASSKAAAAATKVIVEQSAGLMTQRGWITTFVLFGSLALVSGYNAITAKKNQT